MLRGHIWPLVAGKRQIKLFSSPKKGFSGPQNKVFHILNSENTKKRDFEKNFFVSNAKRSTLASAGKKTAKERIFRVQGIRFFVFCGLQWPKMTPPHKKT